MADVVRAGRADEALRAVRQLSPRASIAYEMRAVQRAEIFGSTALAGSRLSPVEVDALLDRDRARGNHRLGDYILVRAYADAARGIADTRGFPAGDRRPLIAIEELRALNARVTAGTTARGGAWRQGNAMTAGVVSPAAWLVAREVTTLLDRFGRGPQNMPIAEWLAKFLGRFARLLPFEAANGRTGRLAANLLLRRLDGVPLVFAKPDRRQYASALAAAEADDQNALARIVAAALIRTSERLVNAGHQADTLVAPLRTLAGDDYTSLAKAAQRGRLRTIVRSGRYYTTAEWIDAYRTATRRVLPAPATRPIP